MPAAVPKKGDVEVRFAAAPKGWKVGDTLLFPGLDRQENGRDVGVDPWTGREMPMGRHQDEERLIQALSADGKTVTLDRPLAYQHGDVYGYAEAVPVGNLSRNVVIESENAEKVGRRGHVMFMHTQDVVLDSALFRELGRTNVEGELTSPRVKDGKVEEGSDANTIGRYAVHFHIRWGATYKQQPFVVRNCAVVGSPKLGDRQPRRLRPGGRQRQPTRCAARTSSRRTAARSAASRATSPSAPTAPASTPATTTAGRSPASTPTTSR